MRFRSCGGVGWNPSPLQPDAWFDKEHLKAPSERDSRNHRDSLLPAPELEVQAGDPAHVVIHFEINGRLPQVFP